MRHFTARISFAICILATAGYAGEPEKAAVKVFVDPATGKVRQPTPADIENLLGATRARTAAPQTSGQPEQLDKRYGPGGAVGVKLGSDSVSYVVATRLPDGKLAMDCVSGEKVAEKAVSGAK